jgi:hypothetical protein
MQTISLIRTIIEEEFPEDYLIVGKSDVEKKLNAKDPLSPALEIRSDHNIDVSASLDVIDHAIVVLRDMTLLYASWRAANVLSKSPTDLKKAVEQKHPHMPEDVVNKLLKLAEKVIELWKQNESL